MMRRAFSLIELLVVVAIISILATIAVSNYLEASTRSGVSRVKSDMRTLATALELYCADHNHYPIPAPHNIIYPSMCDDLQDGIWVPNELSTPVAYLTSVRSVNDFFKTSEKDNADIYNNRFEYYNFGLKEWAPRCWGWRRYEDKAGRWKLTSRGPYLNHGDLMCNPSYDPTNGTLSLGGIHRSQKFTEFHPEIYEMDDPRYDCCPPPDGTTGCEPHY